MGQASRHARQVPQWSTSAVSNGSSRLVNIEPRNNQEPNSRLTRLVCLPCQPMPATAPSGFSITGAVSTNTLTSPPARATHQPASCFELAFDDVVIVPRSCVDRDRSHITALRRLARIFTRAIVDRQHHHRTDVRPECDGVGAALPRRRHPVHIALVAQREPSRQPFGGAGRVRRRHPARIEAQFASARLQIAQKSRSA